MNKYLKIKKTSVTILILIDGFLQFNTYLFTNKMLARHNPYFNRWFSAITKKIYESQTDKMSQSLF